MSRLTSDALRERFRNPELTEAELVLLMRQFLEDVQQGRHLWCNTFYALSKVGEC